MIHLSALEASRLLGKHPKAKKAVDKVKKAKQVDALHGKVLVQLAGFPDPVTELLFHSKRHWRLDYAWPDHMIALEVHGGIYSGGRHTRGRGFVEDRCKMNEASLLGWIVLEITPEHIESGQLRTWLLSAFDLKKTKRGPSHDYSIGSGTSPVLTERGVT
ncbi:hypothetical protein [Aeromonas enteropelogenes]|uniref:DUF559 domain-containing protein n=1 Tax=Aeromonas enteropelogenes TaxID=29489 RepID=A0ABU9J6E8_AEREN